MCVFLFSLDYSFCDPLRKSAGLFMEACEPYQSYTTEYNGSLFMRSH